MIKHIKAGYAGRNSLSGITAEAALSLNVINIAFGHVADSRIFLIADAQRILTGLGR